MQLSLNLLSGIVVVGLVAYGALNVIGALYELVLRVLDARACRREWATEQEFRKRELQRYGSVDVPLDRALEREGECERCDERCDCGLCDDERENYGLVRIDERERLLTLPISDLAAEVQTMSESELERAAHSLRPTAAHDAPVVRGPEGAVDPRTAESITLIGVDYGANEQAVAVTMTRDANGVFHIDNIRSVGEGEDARPRLIPSGLRDAEDAEMLRYLRPDGVESGVNRWLSESYIRQLEAITIRDGTIHSSVMTTNVSVDPDCPTHGDYDIVDPDPGDVDCTCRQGYLQ